MDLYLIGKRMRRCAEAYKIGNAQSIGSYQIQSSYFASRCDNGCLAVLADGTADHVNGRRCAMLAVEACMHEFRLLPNIPEEVEFSAFSDFIATKILRDMRDIIFSGKTPYLSLSFQFIKGSHLYYYSIGSNQVFLYDGSNYQLLNGTCGSVDFGKGMTAGMISRGVWEALNEIELVSYLMKRGHPYEKAQRMLAGVQEKHRKAAKTAAILFVEGCV